MSSNAGTAEPTAEQTALDRPPEGLGRGRYPVPAWVVMVLGAVVVVLGVLSFVRRALRKVKR